MKIKKAAEICHMSPRNIRFYEEIGLIKPTRVENGYRDYDTEDIERLQQIRVLRNLGIGLESIKAYFKKEKTFEQIIHRKDYWQTVLLMAEFARRLDANLLKKLKEF